MQSKEPEVQVAAAEEGFEDPPDALVEGAVGLQEALVPEPEELFHGIFHDLLEGIGGGAGPVAGSRLLREGRGHGLQAWAKLQGFPGEPGVRGAEGPEEAGL